MISVTPFGTVTPLVMPNTSSVAPLLSVVASAMPPDETISVPPSGNPTVALAVPPDKTSCVPPRIVMLSAVPPNSTT